MIQGGQLNNHSPHYRKLLMNIAPLLIAFWAIFLIFGCRPVTDDTSDTTSVATTMPQPTITQGPETQSSTLNTPPPKEASHKGGVFRRVFTNPPTLDPHLTTDATSAAIIIEIFGGLVTISPDLKVVPDIAKDWDISDNGLTYTFYLREDVTFHDKKLVTAHDFKWSFERSTDPITGSLVVEQYLGDIVGVIDKLHGKTREVKGIKVIDSLTLEITIDQPKSYFISKLTYPTAFVLDKENVETGSRWARTPNGTGPFKLQNYVPGEYLTLEKNPDYHLGPPHLDTVEMILSGGTSMLMYENDEIDIAGVGMADIDRLEDPNEPLSSDLKKAPPSFSTNYIGMNTSEPPFDDVKVRQALNYAINKQEIATLVLADLVTPAKGILPPGFPAYNEELEGYYFNPERAQILLKESRYGGDMENFPPIVLTVSGGFGASVGLDLEVILESWRQVLGIEVEIQQTEFATYLQDLHKNRFQMFEIGWIADYPDPENFLDLLFYSESSNNHTRFNDPLVDKLLLDARTETDTNLRYNTYQQVEELIVANAPWIPLWHGGEQRILIKPWVENYYLTQLIVPRLRFVEIHK
ncbi:peptide ABC transporter substrate-binding protein [SAR202 cluster bacterium AD-804-J14_MRT_500m]|nr:peptide ABC transporter substrate-binding protein [SAR202 cluster bacterium AD-804-J14_MRT_500m]